MIIFGIQYSALSTYNVRKRFIKNSHLTDVYGQINSLRNSNVFSCFLKFCTLSAASILSGSSVQMRGAYAQKAPCHQTFSD